MSPQFDCDERYQVTCSQASGIAPNYWLLTRFRKSQQISVDVGRLAGHLIAEAAAAANADVTSVPDIFAATGTEGACVPFVSNAMLRRARVMRGFAMLAQPA